MSGRRSHTRGVALVSILLIVAVATALAYEMASRHTLDVVRSRLLFDTSQARQYALGGEAYARQLLYADWKDAKTRAKDTLLEEWAAASPTGEGGAFAIEHGTLAIRIEDLRSRFNLNALLGQDGEANKARLALLLRHLQLNPDIADAWMDWIDADQKRTGHAGAEDSDYSLREPARRAANQPAVHVSEFRLVAQLPRDEFEQLLPHITVLPQPELVVNVNTATDVVLAALNEKISPTEAQQMHMVPRDFDSVQQAVAEHAKLSENAKSLAVNSDFFLVRTRAEVGEARVQLASSLYRDAASGVITVYARSFGDRFDSAAAQAAQTEDEAAS